MKAADIMTSSVVSIDPDASIADCARLLLTNRISGVPVLEKSGRLVGIVSEGDLLRRSETETDHKPSWWLTLLTSPEQQATLFVREHGHKVRDIMTRIVRTVSPDTPLREVAAILERNRIKRVPVVSDDRLVGIISRANILQALASRIEPPARAANGDDAAIRERFFASIGEQTWTNPAQLNVIVHDGILELWGVVDSQAERKALVVAAEVTSGVRSVNDNLAVRPMNWGV